MVIVEGPDGAGKSTLVKRLSEDFGIKVGKRGVKDRDKLYEVTLSDTMRALSTAVDAVNYEPRIWDRLYFSDLVYAPVQGREVAFRDAHSFHIRALLITMRVPVILCLPKRSVVHENVAKDRHQMDGVRDNIDAIYEGYVKLTPGFPFLYYDYTIADDYARLLPKVTDYLERRKARS